MSRFYVGQRVRVVRAITPEGQCCIGRETSIGFFIRSDLVYLKDGLPPPPNGDDSWHCYTWQLEPLTDPGREVVSWEACEWNPEHLREVIA
jgi:hypothetical protein